MARIKLKETYELSQAWQRRLIVRSNGYTRASLAKIAASWEALAIYVASTRQPR